MISRKLSVCIITPLQAYSVLSDAFLLTFEIRLGSVVPLEKNVNKKFNKTWLTFLERVKMNLR